MTPTTADDRAPRRRPGATVRTATSGGAVLDLPGGAVALNPTALALWELCDGTTSVGEMVSAVCVLFEVDPARARRDVEGALDEMARLGVLA